jgi:hypothetical protein
MNASLVWLRVLRRATATILTAATLLVSAPAEAGRRPFIWVWDTEVLHEREVEVEQWVWEMNLGGPKSAWLWWAPVIGITDNIELAIPIEAAWWWRPSADDPDKWQSSTQFETWGLSLRWRLAENDPDESGPFVPLVRVAVKHLLVANDHQDQQWQFESNLVMSYDYDKLHSVVDIGFFYTTADAQWASYAIGSAYAVNDAVRLGGEVFGEVGLSSGRKTFTMAGPDIGWTHGRAWITVGCLIGLTDKAARFMPRLIWALKF